MPITLVQSATSVVDTPIAFPSDNTIHNLLVVLVYHEGTIASPAITCTDSQGNTYTAMTLHSNSPGTVYGRLFYCLDAKAGPNTVTGQVLDTGTPVSTQTVIHEFAGVTAMDASAFAMGTGLAQDSGAVTTSFPSELIFGYELANTTGGQNGVTSGPTFTNAEGSHMGTIGLTQYKVVSSTGSYSSDTTSTVGKSGIDNWMAEVVTFNGPSTAVPRTTIIEF